LGRRPSDTGRGPDHDRFLHEISPAKAGHYD
jgi:hypothetical protein